MDQGSRHCANLVRPEFPANVTPLRLLHAMRVRRPADAAQCVSAGWTGRGNDIVQSAHEHVGAVGESARRALVNR